MFAWIFFFEIQYRIDETICHSVTEMEDEDEAQLMGTPVDIPDDPEVSKRPIPIHEQVVTDDRGRRRFHGAFTGGFSAGYFNTVGSKEGSISPSFRSFPRSGWTPSTFKSSRTQKKEVSSAYQATDFMDDEDFAGTYQLLFFSVAQIHKDHGIAPMRVSATETFEDKSGKKRPMNVNSSGHLAGAAMNDLLLPTDNTVGIRCFLSPCAYFLTVFFSLLRGMGWKEYQGVGPRKAPTTSSKKVYGCAMPVRNESITTNVLIFITNRGS